MEAFMRLYLALALPLVISCGSATPDPVGPAPPSSGKTITISIVTTNDLHGHVDALPMLGGYLRQLRAVREREGGAVLLVDAGDMFQGTLESNLSEGAAVVAAYNALRYDAATVGNHEFDFGPAGPAATPGAADDARGALKARAAEAKFPILMANVVDESGAIPAWPNMPPSVILDVKGVKVGLVGVTTIDTPKTTIAANFVGLRVTPLKDAVAREAEALRAKGAEVVVALAHAGGTCRSFDDPNDLRSCTMSDELFALADTLPRGTVDVLVGGHTNTGLAHMVNGIAVVEAFNYGKAFGRVDVAFDPKTRKILSSTPLPPKEMCLSNTQGKCKATRYEGSDEPVKADPAIEAVLLPALEATRKIEAEPLGVTVEQFLWRANVEESALGNFMTDNMRKARPDADVAISNGGALRADLPLGPLTYGHLYRAFPFDNHIAIGTMSAADLEQIIAKNLTTPGPILTMSGLRAAATCNGPTLQVTLTREDGSPLVGSTMLRVVTSDFLSTGGDGLLGVRDFVIEAEPIREAIAANMRANMGGTLKADQFYSSTSRRIRFSGQRPVRCAIR